MVHGIIEAELSNLFRGEAQKEFYCGKYRNTYVLFFKWREDGICLFDRSLYIGSDGPRRRFNLSESYKLHLSGNDKTFPKGAKVLALKPNGERYFTKFNPATVVSKLTEKGKKKQYKIKFDGETEEFYVNQEFVIPTEEFWHNEDAAYAKPKSSDSESDSSDSSSTSSDSSDEKDKKKKKHSHHKHGKHGKHHKHTRKSQQPNVIIIPIFIPYGASPNYQRYIY